MPHLAKVCALAVVGFGSVAGPAEAGVGFDTSVGYTWGNALVDGVDVGRVQGLHVETGVRLRGPVSLSLGYDLLELAYPTPAAGAAVAGIGNPSWYGSTGLEHRLGATVRYAFERIGRDDGGLHLWLEAGPGFEYFRWDSGGTWLRPDATIGLGTTMWFRGHRYHALELAVHGTFAPRTRVGDELSCGGPCDTATAPSGWDRSVMWDVSFAFGR